MKNTAPTFAKQDDLKFFRTLNSRVNTYFKENNLDKTGNWKLHLKAVVMFSIFLTPYFFLLAMDMPFWTYLLLNLIIGIGMAGVGMNVMHDGNHGAYSNKSWVNKFMGGSIYILAGNVYNWQVQHNVLHHTYTNILGHDEDLEAGRILRFSKTAKWYSYHKFQHYYSVFLYGLLTFNWAITTDFLQMKRYLKRNLSYGEFKKPDSLDHLNHYQSYLFLYLVSNSNGVRYHLVESDFRLSGNALYRWIDFECRIPIGTCG